MPVQKTFVVPSAFDRYSDSAAFYRPAICSPSFCSRKIHISRQTAELFKTLALSAKLAVLPFDANGGMSSLYRCLTHKAKRSACSAFPATSPEQKHREEALGQSERFENATVRLHWVGPDGIIRGQIKPSWTCPAIHAMSTLACPFHVDANQEVVTDILERYQG